MWIPRTTRLNNRGCMLCVVMTLLVVVARGCTADAPILDSLHNGANQGVTDIVSHLIEALVLSVFI